MSYDEDTVLTGLINKYINRGLFWNHKIKRYVYNSSKGHCGLWTIGMSIFTCILILLYTLVGLDIIHPEEEYKVKIYIFLYFSVLFLLSVLLCMD
jgi:hypothetical protein